MTKSGLRAELAMPSVYFYLAVFDALGDIKSQWTRTKSKIVKLVNKNEGFTEEEKHYLCFLLKVNNAFEQVLNQKPVELAAKLNKQYLELAEQVETDRLHRYLRAHYFFRHSRISSHQAQRGSARRRSPSKHYSNNTFCRARKRFFASPCVSTIPLPHFSRPGDQLRMSYFGSAPFHDTRLTSLV